MADLLDVNEINKNDETTIFDESNDSDTENQNNFLEQSKSHSTYRYVFPLY